MNSTRCSAIAQIGQRYKSRFTGEEVIVVSRSNSLGGPSEICYQFGSTTVWMSESRFLEFYELAR